MINDYVVHGVIMRPSNVLPLSVTTSSPVQLYYLLACVLLYYSTPFLSDFRTEVVTRYIHCTVYRSIRRTIALTRQWSGVPVLLHALLFYENLGLDTLSSRNLDRVTNVQERVLNNGTPSTTVQGTSTAYMVFVMQYILYRPANGMT